MQVRVTKAATSLSILPTSGASTQQLGGGSASPVLPPPDLVKKEKLMQKEKLLPRALNPPLFFPNHSTRLQVVHESDSFFFPQNV